MILFEQFRSKEDIREICKRYNIRRYKINSDNSINVIGSVHLTECGLTEIPLMFNEVTDGFYCFGNNLTSLYGCPKEVGVEFVCSSNRLTSLEYGPIYVGDRYDCSYNSIKDLKYLPVNTGEKFILDIRYNRIKTLKGISVDNLWNINVTYNPLPKEIRNLLKGNFMDYSGIENMKYIIKWQDDYNIWNLDGTLNVPRFNMMMSDKSL